MFNSAWAMAPAPGQTGAATEPTAIDYVKTYGYLILIFAVLYFLVFRPQQKKQKELQGMLNNLKKGDKVITNGGLIGVISEVKDKRVMLKLGEGTKEKDFVKVEILKSAIISVENE